jgi:alpha-beta hydrolase superfamily lysophospholipase
MGPIPLSFDVAAALPADVTEGRPTEIAAWLFLPDDLALLGPRPVTMVLLAGGSYDKRYWHVEVPGHSGYSAAEHLAGLGNVVLIADHLGVGESTRVPRQKKATRFVAAQAMDAAVRQFHERLARGALVDGLPAIPDFARIGGGHSMGAMLTVIQQARHRTHEAIMVLGYTADGVHTTRDGQRIRTADLIPPGEGPDYPVPDRAPLHEAFHWHDVPGDVIAADDAIAVPTPSALGLTAIATGVIREEAARIDVPVYFCNGERDVSPDLHAEPGYFRACSDFTLQCLPDSAHCHNFASTRHILWNRMHSWSRTLR